MEHSAVPEALTTIRAARNNVKCKGEPAVSRSKGKSKGKIQTWKFK